MLTYYILQVKVSFPLFLAAHKMGLKVSVNPEALSMDLGCARKPQLMHLNTLHFKNTLFNAICACDHYHSTPLCMS